MKAILLFLLLLPLSNHAFASPVAKNETKEVLASLKTDLKIFTKTLSRDVPVYTWVKNDRLTKSYGLPKKSSVIYNHKAFRKFIVSRTKKLLKYDKTDEQWLGKGLYTYHNPVGSADYGDALIEIMVPKGNSYLDLRYTNLEFEEDY